MFDPSALRRIPFLSGALLNVVHAYARAIAMLPSFLRTRLQYFTTAEGTMPV